MAASLLPLLHCTFLVLAAASTWVSAKIVQHTFQVQNVVVSRVCKEQEIVTVNGEYPGPTLYVHEGDMVVVHVFNKSPYDITIHWHGVQMLSNGWADGASFVTQCPIHPGDNYTYKFNITKQEGTLWWHAHMSWLRATVHGALIIYPKEGHRYPFETPHKEIPILLGEWWNASLVELENRYLHESMMAAYPKAFTINGQPGDLSECSSKDMFKEKVTQGKTYLLRIINVALNHAFFFKIANHNMKIVSIDASYIEPYISDIVYIAPGQTVDALLEADQPPTSYYMAAHGYFSWDESFRVATYITRGVLFYEGESSPSSLSPLVPNLPDFRDTLRAYNFSTSLKGLRKGPFWIPVPQKVNEHMFITTGLGTIPCRGEIGVCVAPDGGIIYGSMNNVSFQLPTQISILEAFYKNLDGVYTPDFPNKPPVKFDYANTNNQLNKNLMRIGELATKVKRLKFNATVQIVFQNTAIFTMENHPIHLHGFNFHVLAQGFGNYDHARDEKEFNLINPQLRNTIAVPTKGWVVIRFQANNPGVWLMHCHLEYHQSVGLGTAFIVENDPSHSTSLPPPPLDFPTCDDRLNDTPDDQRVRLPIEKSSATI